MLGTMGMLGYTGMVGYVGTTFRTVLVRNVLWILHFYKSGIGDHVSLVQCVLHVKIVKAGIVNFMWIVPRTVCEGDDIFTAVADPGSRAHQPLSTGRLEIGA